MKALDSIATWGVCLLAGLFGTLVTVPARAQPQFPGHAITLVVPTAAGGNLDVAARIYAAALGEALKQIVIVDNRAGASSNIGFEYVARSVPDGYTLLFTGPEITVNPYLYKLSFNPATAFTPITVVEDTPVYMVARKGLAVSSVADVIAYAKAHPHELTYSSAGVGSPPNLAAEMFKALSGTDILHVPYKGAPQALNDLIAGRIDIMFPSKPITRGHVAAGNVKLLAVTSGKRLSSEPDLPTVGETVKGYSVLSWAGVMVPAATPKPIVDVLTRASQAALADRKTIDSLEGLGLEVVNSTPKEMSQFLAAETEKWALLVRNGQMKASE
jgi:tripartite-type tricarboxylate transporter receptor subunit TctC